MSYIVLNLLQTLFPYKDSVIIACFFILTASNFYIIDFQTKAILLEGKSENGMYPLRLGKKSHKGNKSFIALLGIRTSSLVWHFRLGHPSNDIVTRVV
jgi:hypothetical protein